MGNSPVTSSPVVLHNNAIIRDVRDIDVRNDVTLALTFSPDNAVLDVSIHQVSEVSLAYTSNLDDTIRHYGVIVKNEFHVSDGKKYQYLVFHALRQNNVVPNATKIDIFFANRIQDTENRLRGVMNGAGPVLKTDFTPASAITTAPIIANAIRGYLSAEFDYGLMNNKMALQDYEGLANCFLVAKHFHSICLGNNPTEANEIVEEELQLVRGKLLRASGVDINQIQEGIPCSDIFFWETRKEATTAKGIFRLQTHKSICRSLDLGLGLIGLFLLLLCCIYGSIISD